MKRVITIKATDQVSITITAKVDTKGSFLTGGEVLSVVDALTEKLMLSVTNLPYNKVPLGRVRVK